MPALTPLQQRWLDAGKSLTPQNSLQAADGLGKFVFANVAIIGTAVTGFGLFGSAAPTIQRGPHIFSLPLVVALVAVSMLLAIGAIVPHLGSVNPGSLTAIEAFYRWTIWRRAVCAIASAVVFAAALAVAAAVAIVDRAPTDAAPAITAGLSGSGPDAKLTVDVQAANDSAAGRLTTTVTGRAAAGAPPRLLCRQVTAGATGPLSAHCDAAAGGDRVFAVEAQVARGGGSAIRATLTLNR